ncbi:MAG: hypothetical protein V7703_15160 [Hyphomicrobiales bacterium]
MQSMKSMGFRCKEDRAKDMELAAHYGAIGIKSVQAAQSLCTKPKTADMPKSISATAKPAS